MQLMTKIFSAIRGGTRETLESITDANALRIFDQEIHDTETYINRSKHDLTQVMAEKIRMNREITALKHSVEQAEELAINALENDEPEIAHEHAIWIADSESSLKDMEQKHRQLEKYETDLNRQLKKVITQLQHYRREWRMAKATEKSQAASKRISHSNHNLGSQINNMEESLTRIKNKQQECFDVMTAREKMEDSIMDSTSKSMVKVKLKTKSVESVLARLQQKTSSGD